MSDTSVGVLPKLRVVSLQAQNIMRLSAVDITWDKDASTLTVGGRNGAGKSSVLNAVAMALGGAALCPEEPIRRGESEGFVEVNLGELVVRREFSREKIDTEIEGIAQGYRWGETKSKIVLRNAEGIRLGTPQAILDKLIGKLSFDPLSFVSEEPKRQDAILRQIVGLDVTDLEDKRKAAYERRTHWNREHKAALIRIETMPLAAREGAPAVEIPMKSISDEMLKAEEYRKLADEAARAVEASRTRFASLEAQCQTRYARIDELNKQITIVQKELVKLEGQHQDEEKNLEALSITAGSAMLAVPDVALIRKKLTEVEELNAKHRAYSAWLKAKEDATVIEGKAKVEDDAVKQFEQAKEDALRAVKFPVEGLGFGADGVTFNDIPFKQASTAEQIKVSVAVGFALNPGLKLLLVRNGNALDEDSMKIVAAQAEEAGGQILMEYVTKDAGQVSVMIEDGHVA